MCTLGEEQGIADRHAHIGRTELGLDRSIVKLDHRVDDRLRMLDDGDAISGATITTNAVVNGVNAGLEFYKTELGGGKNE